MGRGIVYLVGAGPGDPGLVALRAREVLASADVVFYDGLVSRGVLRLIPRGTRKLRVAKGPRHRDRFPQERINRLLVAESRAGNKVVRLKGGDPLLFSRGGEEVEFLRAQGIRFEIVPGISSALAAPAYAGIPLTERGASSSVALVTGHESRTFPGRPVNWSGLARAVDTLVVLMGAATLPTIAAALLGAGLAPDTPVAAVRWATTPRQRTALFTLAEAVRPSFRARLESPSVLVVGPTVARAHRRAWYSRELRWASPGFVRAAERIARERAIGRAEAPARPVSRAARRPPAPPSAGSLRPRRRTAPRGARGDRAR